MSRSTDLDYIAQIAVGTAVKEFDDDPENLNAAWTFLNTEIDKHENEVAVVILGNDIACIGGVYDRYSAIPFFETPCRFKAFLDLNGFYGNDE